MLRLIRTVLAGEGLVMSWKSYMQTRKLEARRKHGDTSVESAVALTPQGRLFKMPNGLTASAYFALMTLLSGTGLIDRKHIRRLGVGMAWISLSISAYLVYQLLFVLRRNCPLCMRAHMVNLALTLTVTAKVVAQEQRDQ